MTQSDKQELIKEIRKMKQNVRRDGKLWLAPDFEIPIVNQTLDKVIELIKKQ